MSDTYVAIRERVAQIRTRSCHQYSDPMARRHRDDCPACEVDRALDWVLAALPVVEAHAKLVGDVDALIAESAGVDGLHLNGEVAGWDTLVRHGRYEEWLMSLDDGRDALAHLEEVTRA